MPVMTGKRAFLELLKQEGVEILFGNPGTTELPLMDALASENELRFAKYTSLPRGHLRSPSRARMIAATA